MGLFEFEHRVSKSFGITGSVQAIALPETIATSDYIHAIRAALTAEGWGEIAELP
jgi:hypothetical protein